MRKYEGVFILLSNIDKEVRTAEIEKIKNIITERQGTIEKVSEWGMKKLAYEIKKKKDGYYVLMNFTADSETIKEVDRICKITENVLRHMIIRDESK